GGGPGRGRPHRRFRRQAACRGLPRPAAVASMSEAASRPEDGAPLLGPPDYSGPILSDIVPAAALSLGAGIFDAEAHERARRLGLDRESRTAIVILIDGLGERQLRRYSGYTPFFRSLAQTR